MRNAFIQELVILARQHPQIALIVGDLGYSVVEPFADEFPDRFLNAGVAEQNMTGLAAGMASEGYHVFTYSIANFPTFRCAEQIRNDIDYHGLPVTTVAVGGGLAYGALGYSHHAVQDYALLRILPNMLIAAPGDQLEVRACLRYLVNNPQPSYLRLGRAGEVQIHTDVPTIEPGRWLPVRYNKKERKVLLSTGAALHLALSWQEEPSYQDFAVFSLPLWSMKAKTIQPAQLVDFDSVVTLEDHLTDGGFGSWLLESSNMNVGSLNKIEIKALNSTVCGMVASQGELNRLGGIVPCINPNHE
jgi:transketolase